jgi:multidrug efflux pump subunit AcrA (membrane-fusion protein)
VITTVPTADRQKATVLVRIAFDALDPRILPDMGVKVAFLQVADGADEAEPTARVVIPVSAPRSSNGDRVVFVITEDRIERRVVTLGAIDDEWIEVLSGLAAGERIVADGPLDLKDGDRVVAAG